MSSHRLLTNEEGSAKVFLAKSALHTAMPIVSTFLLVYSVRVEAAPLVFPAYVTPRPEIVVALKAVSDLPVWKLRVLLLHEGLHPATNVWMRFMMLTGLPCVGPEWDLFTTAHDYVINLLINEEIKRLDRLQLNGQRAGQDPLLRWPGPEDGLEYSEPLLDYEFWGMPVEAVFGILKQRQREGRSVPKSPKDCVFDGSTPEQIRQGHERALAMLVQAALEAASVEAQQEESGLVKMAIDFGRPKESFLSQLCQEIHQNLPQEERRTYAKPDPRCEDGETGDILRPGLVPAGEATCVAIDVSSSAHAGSVAAKFIEDVDTALDSWNGPLLLVLWDSQVRLTMMVQDRWAMRSVVQDIRSGGDTSLDCLLERLRYPGVDDFGQEIPAIGMLIVCTDGEVSRWPEWEEMPCDDVLMVYTRQAPPERFRSLYKEVA